MTREQYDYYRNYHFKPGTADPVYDKAHTRLPLTSRETPPFIPTTRPRGMNFNVAMEIARRLHKKTEDQRQDDYITYLRQVWIPHGHGPPLEQIR